MTKRPSPSPKAPEGPSSRRFNMVLSTEDWLDIEQAAKRKAISMSHWVRMAIRKALGRDPA